MSLSGPQAGPDSLKGQSQCASSPGGRSMLDEGPAKKWSIMRGAFPVTVPGQEPADPSRTLGGKDSVNRLPLPGSLVTDRSPPIRAAIRFATARPRP